VTWMLVMACLNSETSATTDAQHFAAAADPTSPTSSALRGCQSIGDSEGRGDCVSLALNSHGASSRRDCAAIESARWEGECYFLLAEAEREQDLARATATCGLSNYARECMEHLIRSEAQARVLAPPETFESVIAVLAESQVAEDAGVLFWQEWALHRVDSDLMAGRRNCNSLEDSESCRIGINRARKQLVRALGLENRCAASRLGRPLLVLSDGRAVLDSGVPVGLDGACGF